MSFLFDLLRVNNTQIANEEGLFDDDIKFSNSVSSLCNCHCIDLCRNKYIGNFKSSFSLHAKIFKSSFPLQFCYLSMP